MSANSKRTLTVKQKIAALDELVAWFDSDDFELEQAVSRFKEAEKLAVEIENDLRNLQNDIEVVKQRFDTEKG